MSPATPARGDRVAPLLLPLGALAVVLVATPYKSFDLDRYFVPKELVLHLTATVAALILLMTASRRRLGLSLIDTSLTVFLILSAISAAMATNAWLSTRAVAISTSAAAVFWTARTLAGHGYARRLVWAVAAAAAVAAVTALLQAYGVDSPYFSLNRAPGGTFGNRNFVAHVCAIAMPAILYLSLTSRRSAASLAGAACCGVVVAALVLSRSRAAWLALGTSLGLALLIALMFRARWRGRGVGERAATVAIVSAAAIALSILLPNTLEWKSDSPYLDSVRGVVNYKQGSGRGRLVQYANSLRMAVNRPLVGVGPGNWPVAYPRYALRNDPSLDAAGMAANPWPSSDLVAFLSERGAPAFLSLVLVLLLLLLDALSQIRRSRDAEQLFRALALGAAVAATLVVGAFDAVLLLAAPSLLAWMLFGALSSTGRRPVWTISGAPRALLPIVILLIGAGAVLRNALEIRAMSLYAGSSRVAGMEHAAQLDPGSYRVQLRLAQAYIARGSCDRAKAHASRAHDLFPSAPAPRRLLASCGVRERSR